MGVWDTQASIPIAHPKSYDCGQPTAECLHIFFSLALPENLLRWVLVSLFWRWWSPVADRTIRFWHWCSFHRSYVYSKFDLHVQVSNHSAFSHQSQFPLYSQFASMLSQWWLESTVFKVQPLMLGWLNLTDDFINLCFYNCSKLYNLSKFLFPHPQDEYNSRIFALTYVEQLGKIAERCWCIVSTH